MAEGLLVVEDVGVSFAGPRAAKRVLGGVQLTCRSGEITGIIGRSGVGKTTLLKAIAGLVPLDKGRVLIAGEEIVGPGPDRSLVFQEYSLFPWLTVVKNVEMGVRFGTARVARGESLGRARELLEAVGLLAWEGAYPKVLSGGMRQRVALARSLGSRPKVLLLDEPFGALDAITRVEIQQLVKDIHRQHNQAVVLVTHDITEAVLLSDSVCVLGPEGAGGSASIRGWWRVEHSRAHLRPEDLGDSERKIVRAARSLLSQEGER